MDDSRNRMLPPMSALNGFAAAAEHESFSSAGRAIGRTQGAVSRQVALLEDWLGLSLFERVGRDVRLTQDGRNYAAEVGPALDTIRRATSHAMKRPPDGELNIATLPGFGMRWLAPRLPGLTRSYPDITVSFAARSDRFDLRNERFHAAIHFGEPDWPGMNHDLLFSEQMVPVVAPRLLSVGSVRSPADIVALPLLALESRRGAWQAWFTNVGVNQTAPTPSAVFEQFMMLAQAAVSGAGAALIPSFLIEDELNSGALVRPFPLGAPRTGSYYFVYAPRHMQSDTFRRFRTWLLREAQIFSAPDG